MDHQQGASQTIHNHVKRTAITAVILATVIIAGCKDPQLPGFSDSLAENPSPVQVIETSPPEDAQDVELNTYIQAIFNTTIDSTSITDSTLIIRQGNTIVEGSLSPTDSALTFFPANEFQRDQTIIATISSTIADSQGNTMDQDFEWSFTTREATTQEITPPTVASTEPSPGTTDVSAEISIYARFNKALNPSTVNNNTFLLRTNNNNISGSVSYEDSTAIFNPSENLQDGTVYTATITDDIRDLYGNAPSNNYNWNFITKDVDRTPPHVSSTRPRDDEDDVLFDIQITATFSERVDPASVNSNTFRLRTNNGNVSGSVRYEDEDSTAVFNPSETLQDGTLFTATITDGIRDLNGNAPSNNYNWNFTTKEIDRTPPRVVSTNPRDDADEVSDDIQVTATFSESMDASTINEDTFGLYQWRLGQYRQISGSVSYSGNTATLTPLSDLRNDRHYVAIISSDVTDLAGNELGEVYRWSFNTEDD
ncbi:Ig-like domain-containing protein [Fodinibius sp. Rm-B-1B1-1]|uniref:Ig-like domain-containing protein n=1 Tax=Fodinibius alkaliphilus TaxID=3140241 RepID=UPI00315AF252